MIKDPKEDELLIEFHYAVATDEIEEPWTDDHTDNNGPLNKDVHTFIMYLFNDSKEENVQLAGGFWYEDGE